MRLAGMGGVGGVSPLSDHSAGAFQDATLELRPGVVGDGTEDGGDGLPFDGEGTLFVGDEDGARGKGLPMFGGGGTVLMKLLKERTGRSIPTSDEDDRLSCVNGARILPSRLRSIPSG